MIDKRVFATITGVGHYLPEKVLDNKYFETIVDTSDEWIMTRTGIKERRMIEDGATSDLGARAVLDLLKSKNMSPEEIDCIITATVTPDYFFPNTTCLIQQKIGAVNAWGYDVNAACSAFLFALESAAGLVESGKYKKVVVVGADKMTSITDYQDRNNCILFGDAGAAVLLEPTEDPKYGIKDSILRIDGTGRDFLMMKAGGSAMPASEETVKNRLHYIYQEGKSVFKFAVKGMADVSYEIMQKNNLTSEDVAWLVPHQANLRIIDATAQRMGLQKEKVMINIDKYGNTTAATIPLCLVEYYRNGKLKKGDNVILAAFGAGFTWGSLYLVWGMDNV
ncbi:MAG: ketoacyl-ACP synthase III [Ignavibacteriales bacterium]|jgi:3-oxoacyl-[acyl-carrier-protein] synthase-3|nr:beta-ketoacyl-ACP synthase III [Ignavibacteriaceae bacterium]NLH60144.1 ketoacyl-ACP synthase III [Ignavibacteriales bacterium]